MKYLMFDFEHGSQSIGSKSHIEKTLGFPLLTPSTWNQFQDVIASLYKQETVQTDVQGNKTQGKMLAMAISGAVTKEIAKQKKPGGTLWVGGPRGY